MLQTFGIAIFVFASLFILRIFRDVIHDQYSESENQPSSGTKLKHRSLEMTDLEITEMVHLSILLEEKMWRIADSKTEEIILIAAGRYRERSLDSKSIQELPCNILVEIDQLWENHTNGHFSFRRQSEIWDELATNPEEFEYDSYKRFGQALGWYIPEDEKWLYASQFQFSLTSPPGHLPSGGDHGIWAFGEDGITLLRRCYP